MTAKCKSHIRVSFLGLLFFLLVSVLSPVSVQAAGKLTLSLVSNCNGGSDLGHAFLVVSNGTSTTYSMKDYSLKPGETASIGLRGGAPWIDGQGGAYINAELYNGYIKVYKSFSYVTCEINQTALNKVINYFQKKSWYNVTVEAAVHNCTTAATNAWNKVCPLKYKVIPDNLPADLKLQIKMLTGSKNGSSLTGCGLIKKSVPFDDVFYLSKTGQLYPAAIKVSSSMSTPKWTTSGHSIKLTWKKATEAKNSHTGKTYANGYVIGYKKAGTNQRMSFHFCSGLAATTGTITGLSAGTKYLVALSPVYKCTINGKTQYITLTSSWGATLYTNTVTLSRTSLTLEKGKQFRLKASTTGSTRYTPQWSSSNSSVASVTDSGLIYANGAGRATINVLYGGIPAVCTVTVKESSAAWKSAYKKALSGKMSFKCKGTSRSYSANAFCILDLNDDGIYELITTDRSSCTKNSSKWRNHCHIDLWKYSSGKVIYVGGYLTKSSYTYNVRWRTNQVFMHSYYGKWYGLSYGGVYSSRAMSGSYKTQSLYLNNATNRSHFFG